MRNKGFTLIELMIVVAIIAIIAAIAIPSLLRSRMAANETAAAAACKSYAGAQEIYHRTDYDSDGTLEYCQALADGGSSGSGSQGLAGALSLMDKSFAAAESTGASPTGTPKAGYVFRVLTAQGSNAPGGARSYVTLTNMTIGYGFSAVPTAYDNTGRNTFIISNNGTIYQKDRLTSTDHVDTFDPDSKWVQAE